MRRSGRVLALLCSVAVGVLGTAGSASAGSGIWKHKKCVKALKAWEHHNHGYTSQQLAAEKLRLAMDHSCNL